MDKIKAYFPELSAKQIEQFEALKGLYTLWNEQINVISRKDMDNFYTHHVLHSLAIAKVYRFEPKQRVLDIGTGGGFPGIPLAILFPETHFYLVDSIGKKIKVVQEVKEALALKNVTAKHKRAEELKMEFDFIISRAVTQLPRFLPWTKGKIRKTEPSRKGLKNGILYLKGGDLTEELMDVPFYRIYDIPSFFDEEFFETKKVLYLSRQ